MCAILNYSIGTYLNPSLSVIETSRNIQLYITIKKQKITILYIVYTN